MIHRTRNLPPEDVTTTGASPSPRPSARCWTSPARSPSMRWTPRSPRRWCASSSARGRAGTATGGLAKLVATAAPTRSRLERDFRRLLREHGLPQPASNGSWRLRGRPALAGAQVRRGDRRLRNPRASPRFEADRVRDQVLLAPAGRPLTDHQVTELRAGPRSGSARCCSGQRVFERHDLDHGADRQRPVQVREGLPRRGRELHARRRAPPRRPRARRGRGTPA